MPKKGLINRNERRKEMVEKYADKRASLKKVINDPKATFAEKDDAILKLQKLPRDASPARVRNRCAVTGRPRGYYRKFGISRIMLREMVNRAELPGVRKASW
jgi:small subunit ribosomal protein S14